MTSTTESTIRTVAEQVCDRMRSELLAGIHEVGKPLREEELAIRFGVSRHPIRRALQKLTHEGLLVAKPHCGVVVAASQQEHVGGLLTPMRVQLELYALERAHPNLSADDRAEWQTIVHRMQRASEDQNVQAVLDEDARYHQKLLLKAGLGEMIPLWQGIFGRMRDNHWNTLSQYTDLRVVTFIHVQLLETVFSKSIALARKDWKSHLEHGEFNTRAIKSWESLASAPKKMRQQR